MCLYHFFLCGVSVSPTINYLSIAERLAGGDTLPMGKYLLGSAYLLLHQVSVELRYGRPVKNLGGPWWFIQMWLTLHTAQAAQLDLRQINFPGDYAESAKPIVGRCLSFGEATAMAPGAGSSADVMAIWFAAFYKGFTEERTEWLLYADMYQREYDVPSSIDPTQPTADAEATKIFSDCIRPCILPTGLGANNKHYCSYEFYHPSVAARQLGFGQLPPGLFFVGRVKARATIANGTEYT